MAFIKTEKIMPGMVLSAEVRDFNARLLLPEGQVLEARHLRLLKMWGISQVEVEAAESTASPEKTPELDERYRAIADRVSVLFSENDPRHPAVQEIMRLSVKYRLERPGAPPGSGAGGRKAPRTNPEPGARPMPRNVLASLERIEVKLPEVPELVFELNEIIADPHSSAADIARVVNKSPSLAALLLKIVNSAFYGFRSTIDSISRAVMMIGSKEVSNLAMGITIMKTFRAIPRQVIDVPGFLEHSLACGIFARILAAHSNPACAEQVFVAGMLHDIGRLVLCKYFPELAMAAFEQSRAEDTSLLRTELALLGCTHMQIGKKLLQKWKLPYALEKNVCFHHNPSASPNSDTAAIIQMADMLAHGLGIGGSGEHRVPCVDPSAWQRVRLPAGAYASVVQQALAQIETFRDALVKG